MAPSDRRAPPRPHVRGLLRSIVLLLATVGSGAHAGCSRSSDSEAESEARGAQVPKRVVSLSCAGTDIFLALGQIDRIVAVEEDCPCPGTESKVRIRNEDHPGKLAAFNVESVLALHPDAVIAQPDLEQALEDKGLRIVWSPSHYTYENIPELVQKIGVLLEMQGAAQALLDRMRTKADGMRARTSGLPRTRVYFETTGIGWTVGSQGVMNAMIELAGGENIAKDVPKGNATITAEAIFAADPDVIVLGAFADSVDDVRARPGWDHLKAVRSGRVFHIPIERRNVAQGTPRCVDECEVMLLPWLHPEAATVAPKAR